MFRWTFNPRTLPFSTIKRVSFPPLWSPLLPLFRRRVYTPLWNFRLYSYANSSLFSPFSPCVRRTDHSLLLLLLLLLFSCSSSSFPFISRSQSKETKKEKKKNETKKKRKKKHNPPRYCTSEPRRVSMLCLPIAASKRQTRCNKNLLTLYTLLYIDCTRISNITHPRIILVTSIYATTTHTRTLTVTTHTITRHCERIHQETNTPRRRALRQDGPRWIGNAACVSQSSVKFEVFVSPSRRERDYVDRAAISGSIRVVPSDRGSPRIIF